MYPFLYLLMKRGSLSRSGWLLFWRTLGGVHALSCSAVCLENKYYDRVTKKFVNPPWLSWEKCRVCLWVGVFSVKVACREVTAITDESVVKKKENTDKYSGERQVGPSWSNIQKVGQRKRPRWLSHENTCFGCRYLTVTGSLLIHDHGRLSSTPLSARLSLFWE